MPIDRWRLVPHHSYRRSLHTGNKALGTLYTQGVYTINLTQLRRTSEEESGNDKKRVLCLNVPVLPCALKEVKKCTWRNRGAETKGEAGL